MLPPKVEEMTRTLERPGVVLAPTWWKDLDSIMRPLLMGRSVVDGRSLVELVEGRSVAESGSLVVLRLSRSL
jgi:hypothetical protein